MTGSPAFEIQEGPQRGWARLLVTGELDTSTALTFRRRVRALKADQTHVCIDLSQLEFIDRAGGLALEDVLADARYGSWRVEVASDMSWQAARFFDPITAAGRSTEF
jgi:ABC-type transporter Mla MlaB component